MRMRPIAWRMPIITLFLRSKFFHGVETKSFFFRGILVCLLDLGI